jgi:hypothetical protein
MVYFLIRLRSKEKLRSISQFFPDFSKCLWDIKRKKRMRRKRKRDLKRKCQN